MPVQAIGGFFFRAADPDGLAAWYKQHLGVGGGCAAEGAGSSSPAYTPILHKSIPVKRGAALAETAWC